MSKTLMINITEEEEQKHETIQKYGTDFLEELKDTLHELDTLPISEVRRLVQSDEFTEDRDRIETNFWKEFDQISKDDCSLDSAILLQYYGFNLRKNPKPYEGITMIKELELEELEIV